ncbi:type II secretion system F family protein [Promicromonospora sp. Marseille-Q5078]
MPAIIPALGGALVVTGLIGVIVGLRPKTPAPSSAPRTGSYLGRRWTGMTRRTRILLLAGLAAGVLTYLITGWFIAVLAVPLALAGIPALLGAPPAADRIKKLDAMEEWTRGLAGVLVGGLGLEEALRATLRSTPKEIRPEVTRLVARLRARVSTEEALRAFADDLDDEVGDTIAAYLILASRRRGQGLASVLNTLAQSVAEEVRAASAIEADRAKPRTTARIVTLIVSVALGLLALSGTFLTPYSTPLGQVLLMTYIAMYAALLIWMRRMTVGGTTPRFLGASVRGKESR